MRYFKKIRYSDGGPNDKGTVIQYKVIGKGGKAPRKPKTGFEEWREMSESEYINAYKEARDAFHLFHNINSY